MKKVNKNSRFSRFKNMLSDLKQKARNKLITVRDGAQNLTQKFRENVSEAKTKPRSKRKSLVLGFTTVLGIFGVTLLVPVLTAVAKDLPTEGANPSDICPSPNLEPGLFPSQPGDICPCPSPEPPLVPSERIIGGLSGAAATIYALASSSVPFVVGVVGGLIVVLVILKAQNK
jgi:hypothetical protein